MSAPLAVKAAAAPIIPASAPTTVTATHVLLLVFGVTMVSLVGMATVPLVPPDASATRASDVPRVASSASVVLPSVPALGAIPAATASRTDTRVATAAATDAPSVGPAFLAHCVGGALKTQELFDDEATNLGTAAAVLGRLRTLRHLPRSRP